MKIRIIDDTYIYNLKFEQIFINKFSFFTLYKHEINIIVCFNKKVVYFANSLHWMNPEF